MQIGELIVQWVRTRTTDGVVKSQATNVVQSIIWKLNRCSDRGKGFGFQFCGQYLVSVLSRINSLVSNSLWGFTTAMLQRVIKMSRNFHAERKETINTFINFTVKQSNIRLGTLGHVYIFYEEYSARRMFDGQDPILRYWTRCRSIFVVSGRI